MLAVHLCETLCVPTGIPYDFVAEVMHLEQHMQHIWFWPVWPTRPFGPANTNLGYMTV